MSIQNMPSDDVVVHGGAEIGAPAALGCAAGVLLSGGLGDGARRLTAVDLLTVGVMAAAPLIEEFISSRTESGQRRKRRRIRDGSLPVGVDIYEFEDSAALDETG